jgi:hypothetical protein
MLIAPIHAALQAKFVCVGAVVNVGGDKIETVIVLIQLPLFVTVQV